MIKLLKYMQYVSLFRLFPPHFLCGLCILLLLAHCLVSSSVSIGNYITPLIQLNVLRTMQILVKDGHQENLTMIVKLVRRQQVKYQSRGMYI